MLTSGPRGPWAPPRQPAPSLPLPPQQQQSPPGPGANLGHLAALASKLEPPFTAQQLATHLEGWQAHYFDLEPGFVPNVTTWPVTTFAHTLPPGVGAALLAAWEKGHQRSWAGMSGIVLRAARNMDYGKIVRPNRSASGGTWCAHSRCAYCACACHPVEECAELAVYDAIDTVNRTSRERLLAEFLAHSGPAVAAAISPPLSPTKVVNPRLPSGRPKVGPPRAAGPRAIAIVRPPGRPETPVDAEPVWDIFGPRAFAGLEIRDELLPATEFISPHATHCIVNDRSLLAATRRLALPVVASPGAGRQVVARHEGKLVLWRSARSAGVVVEHVLYAPDARVNVLTPDTWLCEQVSLGDAGAGALCPPLHLIEFLFPVPRYTVGSGLCTEFKVFMKGNCPDPARLRPVELVQLEPRPGG